MFNIYEQKKSNVKRRKKRSKEERLHKYINQNFSRGFRSTKSKTRGRGRYNKSIFEKIYSQIDLKVIVIMVMGILFLVFK